MNFNYIDALLFLVILSSVFVGWQRGFVRGTLDLLRWTGSFLAALYFYKTIAAPLDVLTGWGDVWNQPLAFLLILVAASLLIAFAGNFFLKSLSPDLHKSRINRTLGVFPGFANGLITAALLSALLFAVPLSDGFRENLTQSPTANRLAVFTEEFENALAPVFNPAAEQTLNRITVKPESDERIDLRFKVENPRPRPDLEAEMVELVNRDRAANNLKPLEADSEMTVVARKHSADMFARGYFSHYTPENKSPFDRMREDNVRYTIAGENLALAPTLSIAHTGLMNSPGHRANILRSQFGRVGIGILDGGRRGIMVSQEFRD